MCIARRREQSASNTLHMPTKDIWHNLIDKCVGRLDVDGFPGRLEEQVAERLTRSVVAGGKSSPDHSEECVNIEDGIANHGGD